MTPLSIPSPPLDWQVIQVGPLAIHVYAIMILIGIGVGLWIARRRWVARGGDPMMIEEFALWSIPLGIIGGRLYHVISSPSAYFGEGGRPLDALKIWEGGLGIWGAVALGALGAYIAARRQKVSFSAFMDSAAPGILAAQAIGRIGNYFNQELFGGPTTLPWGLEIDPLSPNYPHGYPVGTLFHPTFLYEVLWNIAGVFVILYLDRRLKLRFGRAFWLYVMVYTAGRLWIETVRIDDAVLIHGVRVNVWVSVLVFLGAAVAFWVIGLRRRGVISEFPAATPATEQAPAKTGARASKQAKTAPSASAGTRGTGKVTRAAGEQKKPSK